MGWYRALTRRDFIRLAAAAAAVGGTISCSKPEVPWRFLRVGEARTLAAMCEQLIPTDETPGAAWAGVVNFVDIQLCGPYRKFRGSYRQGLAALERVSISQFSRGFAKLESDQQTLLMRSMEQGVLAESSWPSDAQKSFFGMVLEHTTRGFYGDPRHGGNRDRISWRMVGLSYPQVRGQQRYVSQS